MADEPENLTLKLLREIRAEQAAMRNDLSGLRDEVREVRAEQLSFAGLLGKVSEAVTAVAHLQEIHTDLLEGLKQGSKLTGGRLNNIEARLARVEQHTGLATT
jgi:hypothetical protein